MPRTATPFAGSGANRHSAASKRPQQSRQQQLKKKKRQRQRVRGEHVIRFDGRPDYRCRIFVRIASGVCEADFHAMFSKVSLVHQARFLPSNSGGRSASSASSPSKSFTPASSVTAARATSGTTTPVLPDSRVGVVAYYAPIFALQACKIFNGLVIRGQPVQVWRMRRHLGGGSRYNDAGQYPLDNSESIQVLNHFLKFGGWSSRINKLSYLSLIHI